MLRATLLLTLLPALAPAAPAPFPRERRDPDAHVWSKPVDGLRVRLVAHGTRYRLGDTVRLTLEIQNVSNSELFLDDPHLRHTVSPSAPRGWAITGVRAAGSGQREKSLHKQLAEVGRRLDAVRLRPGQTHRIEIHAATGLHEAKMELLDEGQPRRQDTYFSDAHAPGLYELRATFRREARKWGSAVKKGWWPGDTLESLPVRIELHE